MRVSSKHPNNSVDSPQSLNEPRTGLFISTQLLRTDDQSHNVENQIEKIEPTAQFTDDPYIVPPVIGNGLIGIVLKMGKGRAVKKAKQLSTRVLLDPGDVEYMNKIVQETLENEFQIFRRLGSTKESSLTFKYPGM